MMSELEKLDLLRLARCENIGPISFFHLMSRFGCAREVLARLPGISSRAKIPPMDAIKRELALHHEKDVRLLSFYEKDYPAALKNLRDAPAFISVKGDLSLLHKTCFGIVGSRNASQAGERVCELICKGLAAQRFVIVSGLARGIDACAHRTCLDTGTIAVVAGGLLHVYPPEHKRLHQEIMEKGLIVSEDRIDQEPYGPLFSKRNRLISGLSWGILVVEASLKSGSLITTKYALEQNRTIFAVPGHPLDIRSKGVNKLIKEGAVLTETIEDILNEHALVRGRAYAMKEDAQYDAFSFNKHQDFSSNHTDHERVLRALSYTPMQIEDLALHLDMPSFMLRGILVEIELQGGIERYPGDAVMLSPSVDDKGFKSNL